MSKSLDRAESEWKEVLRWASDEEEKVNKRLREERKAVGLDTNEEEYAYIGETVKRRLCEIKEKYRPKQ